MKPLVNYCRWHGLSLRLLGRDEKAVWGQLILEPEAESEQIVRFHFILEDAVLTVYAPEGTKVIMLDDMGIPLDERTAGA